MRCLAKGTPRAGHREIVLAVSLLVLLSRCRTRALNQIVRLSLNPIAKLGVDIFWDLTFFVLRLHKLLMAALNDSVTFLSLHVLVVVAQLQGGMRLLDLSSLMKLGVVWLQRLELCFFCWRLDGIFCLPEFTFRGVQRSVCFLFCVLARLKYARRLKSSLL